LWECPPAIGSEGNKASGSRKATFRDADRSLSFSPVLIALFFALTNMPADTPSADTTASYDRLEHRGNYQRQVAEREEEFVVNCLRRDPPPKLLEVGSGTGRFTRHLQQLGGQVVATDVSEEMLDKTRRRLGEATGVHYRLSTVSRLPEIAGYGQFDAAVAMRVVPHCEDWRAALEIVVAAVRPGGLVLFDLWNRSSFVGWLLRRQQHDDLDLVHRLEPSEIRSAVARLPGEVIDTLRWGYPRLGPLQADGLFSLLLPERAYSTTFCLRKA
jgi:SAM-dependent methyltransferase